MSEWEVKSEEKATGWEVLSEQPISTITGKPQPTSEQVAAQGAGNAKWVAQEGLPLMGDIAGSTFAPQLKAAGPLMKLANVGLRGLFAGAGSGAGELAGQAVTGEKIDWKDVRNQALIGGASEAVFPVLKAGAKKLAPTMAAATNTGRFIRDVWRSSLEKKAVQRAEEFVTNQAPDLIGKGGLTFDDVGERILDSVDLNNAIYKKYRDRLSAAASGNIYLDDTAQLLGDLRVATVDAKHFQDAMAVVDGKAKKVAVADDVAADFEDGGTRYIKKINDETLSDQFGYKPGSPQSRTLRRLFDDESINKPSDMAWLIQNVNEPKVKWDSLDPVVKDNRQALKSALKEDLARVSKEGKGFLVEADRAFGDRKDFEKLYKIYKGAIRNTKNGMYLDTEYIIPRLQTRHRQLLKKADGLKKSDPDHAKNIIELADNISGEIEHFKGLKNKLKKSKFEHMAPHAVAGAFAGTWYYLGPAAAFSAEALGAVSALGIMSDRAARIITGASKAGLKTGAHLGRMPFKDQKELKPAHSAPVGVLKSH